MTITNAAPPIDEARIEEFANRVVGDASATTVTVLSSIGDGLGLWRALARGGPATSAELAARSGCVERYMREWCSAMASAGYLDYRPESERFELPVEHALVLADDSTPGVPRRTRAAHAGHVRGGGRRRTRLPRGRRGVDRALR
jgi:hypothetical protein